MNTEKINLTKLIIFVFAISWIGVLPGLLLAHEVQIPNSLRSLEILMTLGPILGALIFIYRSYGITGIKSFLSKLLFFRTSAFVIFIAILFPVIISFASASLGLSISNSSWPESFTASSVISNGFIIFLMYLIINTEELVWRGLVFDRFIEKNGFIKSCLLIIPIWWLFHIPLFLYPEGHQAGYGIIEFTCIVIAQSFILGWIYIRSNRSLFYVHIHHQLLNGFGQAFPIFPIFISGNKMPVWVFCLLLLLTAGILIIIENKKSQKEMRETHV